MVRMHDDVQTTNVGQSDLIGTETSQAYLLPTGDAIRFRGSVHCLSVLLEVDVA